MRFYIVFVSIFYFLDKYLLTRVITSARAYIVCRLTFRLMLQKTQVKALLKCFRVNLQFISTNE